MGEQWFGYEADDQSSSQGRSCEEVASRHRRYISEAMSEHKVDDLRNFENNVRRNVNELRRTRWKFVVLFAVLLVLSVCIFVEVATGPKYSQTPALWVLAWLSLGILPLALFFSFGLQANLISPEMYVRRINKALAPFNIAYDGQDDKLLRVDGRPRETVNSSPT